MSSSPGLDKVTLYGMLLLLHEYSSSSLPGTPAKAVLHVTPTPPVRAEKGKREGGGGEEQRRRADSFLACSAAAHIADITTISREHSPLHRESISASFSSWLLSLGCLVACCDGGLLWVPYGSVWFRRQRAMTPFSTKSEPSMPLQNFAHIQQLTFKVHCSSKALLLGSASPGLQGASVKQQISLHMF